MLLCHLDPSSDFLSDYSKKLVGGSGSYHSVASYSQLLCLQLLATSVEKEQVKHWIGNRSLQSF